MNFAKITLSVALLGAFTLGMAEDTTTQTTTIDAQIEKIQNAPAQERVELMNEFKQQLANMNKEERMAAISQMQEKMQAKVQDNMDNTKEMGNMTHQRAQEMAQGKQAEAMDHMNQMQNMNQMQAGNQMKHMMDQGGAATHSGNGGMSNNGNF